MFLAVVVVMRRKEKAEIQTKKQCTEYGQHADVSCFADAKNFKGSIHDLKFRVNPSFIAWEAMLLLMAKYMIACFVFQTK